MASAYSITKRSNGENSLLSRQCGTVSIFSRGMPCVCNTKTISDETTWGRAELSTRTRLIVAQICLGTSRSVLLTARQGIPRLTAQAYALGLFHVTC